MNLLVITTGTLVILIFSWFFSIKEKRYHGVARFFSFESIFLLLLLNTGFWFRDPFSAFQVISWFLLVASIYPVTAGFIQIRKWGRSHKNFENTTVLVKSGIYSYIRHPMYCSLLLLGTGITFKAPGTVQIILGIINMIAIYFTALIEEKEMTSRFGDEYSCYMKETKMFIPFIV